MFIDKVTWVTHGGSAIYSVDIDPTNTRLATCGMDNMIRVWNLAAVIDAQSETDPSTPRLLASLGDHTRAVNVVRFCHGGKLLASGSDDHNGVVHELRPGKGQAVFGSSEASSHENWKAVAVFRGHANNIADLAWAPDDAMIATASLDGTVGVWEPRTSRRLHALSGHEGFCKGVAWDPLGTYLASQGDDGVRVWRREGWQQVAHLQDQFKHASSQTFALRLSWAPDGSQLAAANGYDPKHQQNVVPVYPRESWARSDARDTLHQFVGHAGPVTNARFNPKMFKLALQQQQPEGGGGGGAADAGAAAPAVPAEQAAVRFADAASLVLALGSSDRTFTVWAAYKAEPLVVGRNFFRQGIVLDLCWSSDGHTMVVSSSDGTIAVCKFEPDELGRVVSPEEVALLIRDQYGDQSLRQRPLLQDPHQLALMEQAAAQPPPLPLHGGGGGGGGALPAAAASASGAAAQQQAMRALAARVMPAHGSGGAAAVQATLPTRSTTLLAGGKRRIAPTRIGDDAAPPLPPPQAAAAVGAPAALPPPSKRLHAAGTHSQAGTAAQQTLVATAPSAAAAASASRAPPPPPPAAAAAAASPAAAAGLPLRPPAPAAELSVPIGSRANPSDPDSPWPLVLHATNLALAAAAAAGGGAAAGAMAELSLRCANERVWVDRVAGRVAALAGSPTFCVAALEGGELLVYSPAGRLMLPPLRASARAPPMMATDGGWKLLVLTCEARLRCYDMHQGVLDLDVDLTPILEPGVSVLSARLSQDSSAPLVVLSSRQGYLWCERLRAWLLVVDQRAPLHPYLGALPASLQSGELGLLQHEVADLTQGPGALPSAGAMSAALAVPAQLHAAQQRAHLETRMSAAMVLCEAEEFKRWLLCYVRHLVVHEDMGRLAELTSDLLGPLRWVPGAGEEDGGCLWQPVLLGLDKRRLLAAEVMGELARGAAKPAVAQLAREVTQQLCEAEEWAARAHQRQQQGEREEEGEEAGREERQQQRLQRDREKERIGGGGGLQ